ncbi:uncharacterized protein LOC107791823 [Nicotiana tabacum]|uniref:uncharacterized protein LOC107791823 n=1 Tax=Nicotiana tabacum TaxID=4097 RepID=UPI00388C50CD
MSYNEGSIVDLKYDHKLHFRYFFLSVGAFIKGFAHMRNVNTVDGTFLSDKYGSCLLSVVAQDKENHIFPIAFCVVNKERDDSWTYFFEQLRHIVDENVQLCIISDRHVSIGNVFRKVFFVTYHGFCTRHIAENMCQRFRCGILIKYFFSAAQSYSTKDFFDHFMQLRDKSKEVANCLANEIGFQKWSRVFFLGNWYVMLTTNIADSLNAMLKDQRYFPIIGLFNHIIRKFAEKFEERHNEMKNALTLFVPSAKKKIKNNMVIGDTLWVHQLDNN